MRVGILGGTFDPVHNGHLALARAAHAELGLDLVLFIPAGEPWRKTREISSAEHRLEMLRLAIAGEQAFGISGAARFFFGGTQGFQLSDLRVSGYSIFGVGATPTKRL